MQVLVTANSLFHDHAPANSLGLASSWIIREGSVMGIKGNATYVWAFGDLADMAAAVEKEVRLIFELYHRYNPILPILGRSNLLLDVGFGDSLIIGVYLWCNVYADLAVETKK